ncbi:MAG: tRNA epoxyqueuosine(34) reductase QueG [Planctomycetes bacterium]|nr:tRNA epoxyqueuosine(34) reductase QueG [Planctomycetota bacterium]
MTPLAARIKEQAHALGFELAGIAPAADADGFAHLQDWLGQGFAGEMEYMSRHEDAHRHPNSILPSVVSVVMVGINYKPPDSVLSTPYSVPTGRIARYAGGLDYHDVLRGKLTALLDWVQRAAPGTRGRAVVDTAPLLERDFARRAGLGWFGKNTMLLNKKLGSYFFLGALLLDLELPIDEPFESSHCGTCTACLDACPTDAFVGPFQLDARRCISYLTIELRGSIPLDLRADMGDWIFGCDVCQEVCPWNRKAPIGHEAALEPNAVGLELDLVEVLGMSEEEFRRRFRPTTLWRTKRAGLLRNAAIALGNRGDRRALPALERALDDAAPVVREAAAWAINQIRKHGQSAT